MMEVHTRNEIMALALILVAGAAGAAALAVWGPPSVGDRMDAVTERMDRLDAAVERLEASVSELEKALTPTQAVPAEREERAQPRARPSPRKQERHPHGVKVWRLQ